MQTKSEVFVAFTRNDNGACCNLGEVGVDGSVRLFDVASHVAGQRAQSCEVQTLGHFLELRREREYEVLARGVLAVLSERVPNIDALLSVLLPSVEIESAPLYKVRP